MNKLTLQVKWRSHCHLRWKTREVEGIGNNDDDDTDFVPLDDSEEV